MSETSILPGSAPVDSGVGSPPPEGDGPDVAGGDRRRQMIIIGGVVGALLLVLVAYLLLHKGSSSPTAAAPVGVSTAAPVSANTGSKSHHGGGTKTLPKVQKNPSVHNPFVPLVQPPMAAGAGSPASTTTVTNASPTATPSSTVLVGPGTVASPQPSSTSGTPTNSTKPTAIQLISVKGNTATFDVFYPNHQPYRRFEVQAPKPPKETVFDTQFALIAIYGSDTVEIVEGSGTPFNLETGIAHKA